jgi:serine protease Do
VFEQLRTTGRVRRGMIGVNAQTVTPVLAAGLGLPRDWGVVLGDVAPSGPAAKAGLRAGDFVDKLDGKVMENGRQLDVNVYRHKVGDKVTLEVTRGTQAMTFQVPVVERKDDPGRFTDLVTPERNLVPRLGILGLDVDAKIAAALGGDLRKPNGVLVAASSNDTFYREEVLFPGDVIHALNGAEVTSLDGLRGAVGRLQPGSPVVCQVERDGQLLYVAFEVE